MSWPDDGAAFHAIAAGSCWLRVPGTEPAQLLPGDVVLLTRGGRHSMSSTPDAATKPTELADAVHISRATLNRRFAELVGQPPMTYLTRWRMELAARHLRDGATAVATAAHAVGYRSEFAFSRAFTRHHGTAPSRYRHTVVEGTVDPW